MIGPPKGFTLTTSTTSSSSEDLFHNRITSPCLSLRPVGLPDPVPVVRLPLCSQVPVVAGRSCRGVRCDVVRTIMMVVWVIACVGRGASEEPAGKTAGKDTVRLALLRAVPWQLDANFDAFLTAAF